MDLRAFLAHARRWVATGCYGIRSLFEGCWPGHAPGGAPTFFASPKKVGKERRADVRAAARCLALLASGGGWLNSPFGLRQRQP